MIASRNMMCVIGLVALALAAASTSAFAAKKLDGAQYLKQAHLSLTDARAIALKACSGTIVSEELEKEKGGSGLRYSFDIKNGSSTHEVGVDAKDGSVLENSVEGPHAD